MTPVPAPQCRDPAEELGAGRDRDHDARGGEEALTELRQPGGEHVVHPETEADERGRDERQHDREVAEHRPPGERRHDRRDDAGAWDEDDVDLRMPEEPEHVLEQQRVAAAIGVEEMRGDEPIENQRRAAEHHRGHREDHHERGDDLRPDENRDAIQRHAGRAHLERGGDDRHRDGERRHFGERDQLRPDVGALGRREQLLGERRIAEPADVRAGVQQE
jgi:hypothetical protein